MPHIIAHVSHDSSTDSSSTEGGRDVMLVVPRALEQFFLRNLVHAANGVCQGFARLVQEDKLDKKKAFVVW